MNRIFAAAMAAITLLTASCGPKPLQDTHFERNLGAVDTTDFHKVFDVVRGRACDELHSLMVIKDGKVAYECYGPGHTADELHVMWSVTKTFTATAIGFAVQDGLMTVEDKVVSFFTPEELPEVKPDWLKQMTVKDLMVMSSGFDKDNLIASSSREDADSLDWAKEVLSCNLLWEPGSRFSYNSSNSYLLSVIFSRVTGKKMADYLDEKLFQPLGIRRYIYLESPQGYNCGGWGLYLTTESLAKMCQFFLNEGAWDGKQLLDPKWIADATSPQIMQTKTDDPEVLKSLANNEWQQGYGYQMWVCTHGGVRLDGAYGQIGMFYPEKNAAVIMTAFSHNTAGMLKAALEYVYPSL